MWSTHWLPSVEAWNRIGASTIETRISQLDGVYVPEIAVPGWPYSRDEFAARDAGASLVR